MSVPLAELDDLWAETLGDPRVTIAVLDGPVDLEHPCFRNAGLVVVPSPAAAAPCPPAALAHGTHVTSIVFGQPGSAVHGVAPQCRGLIIPIFPCLPDGSLAQASQLELAAGLRQAATLGANVINVSGGQLEPGGEAEPALTEALAECARRGSLVVASAGNDGCRCLQVPAAAPTVLAVGAEDRNGTPFSFSNWGDAYRSNGVLAAGEEILGASPGGGVARQTGTSFATPVVSGLAGLLMSLQLKRGLAVDSGAVRAAILEGAEPCAESRGEDCRRALRGRISVSGAIRRLTPSAAVQTDHPTLEETNVNQTMPLAPAPESLSTAPILDKGASSSSPQVAPAGGCGCGGATERALVFALAELGYDFGTFARYEWYQQQMALHRFFDPTTLQYVPFGNPLDPAAMVRYLTAETLDFPGNLDSLIWTLQFGRTPIYAIKPSGSFSREIVFRLRGFLSDQVLGVDKEKAERISVAGYVVGMTTLQNGMTIPVLEPDPRGMFNWSIDALIAELTKRIVDPKVLGPAVELLRQFFEKLYYQLRNLGRTPQERALNMAATNAYAFVQKLIEGPAVEEVSHVMIQDLRVEKTPICRPDSDCWDILITMFDTLAKSEKARMVSRITVDVRDVVPVIVDSSSWPEY